MIGWQIPFRAARRLEQRLGWHAAAKIYRTILRSGGQENARVHFQLGNALFRANDLEGAEHSLSRAVELAPGTGPWHYRLGFVLERTGRLAEAVAGLERIAAETGTRIFTIAHASDGNLHPMIVMDPQDPVDEGPAKDALGQMFHLANRLGGTLTGEHGVGLLKRDWVGAELGDVSLGVQHAIRRALDPLGILNPGKAI